MRPEFPIPSEVLSAYIDNELSEEENADIELALAESESDRKELDQLRGLGSLLGGLPQYEAPRSFALSQEHIREANPSGGMLRFLPVVRSLSVAAFLAFLVVTAITIYDRVEPTGDSNNASIAEDSGTESPADASNNATGDTAPEDSGLVDRGDSAASNAVPPEAPVNDAAAPGSSDIAQVDSTPAVTEAAPEETPVTVATTSDSDDDDNRWLMTSAGLGVLALVLLGLWVVLLRMRRGQNHSSRQAPDITDVS